MAMTLISRKVVCYSDLHLCITQPTQLNLVWEGGPTQVYLLIKRGVEVHLRHYPLDAILSVELEKDAYLVEQICEEKPKDPLCNTQIPLKYTHGIKQLSNSHYTLKVQKTEVTSVPYHVSSEVFLLGEGASCNYSILSSLHSKQRDSFKIVKHIKAENTEAAIYARVVVQGPAQTKLEVNSICYKSKGVRVTQDLGGLHLTKAGEIIFLPEIYAKQCIPEVLNHQVKIKDIEPRVLAYLHTRGLTLSEAMHCYVVAFLDFTN
jgi:hypothetical protein